MSRKIRKFSPDEAVQMMKDGRSDEMFIPLGELPEQLGLSQAEILGELRSGRMVADGEPTPAGYENAHVTIEHLIEWLATSSPAALKTWQQWRRQELH